MTPERVNQARFLLGWSREQLARASRLSSTQIEVMEAGGWIHPLQLAAVKRALAAQGIEFRESGPVLHDHYRRQALTAEQCRVAREQLGWTQRRLGAECGIPAHAITVFEKTGSVPVPKGGADRLAVIRNALEAAGVEFIEDGGASRASG